MRRILIAMALVVGLVGAGSAASSEPADAWQYVIRRGRTGTLLVPTGTFIGVRHGTVPWCCWYVNPSTSTRMTVGRAPARGRQVVSVAYVLQRNSGGWQTMQTKIFHVSVAPRQQRVTVPQPNFEYLGVDNPTGQYRMVYLVSWVKFSTGATLGSARVDPNLPSDHWCGAQLRCTFGPGLVNIRGFATD